MRWGRLRRVPTLAFMPAALVVGVLSAGGGSHTAASNPQLPVNAAPPALAALTFAGHLGAPYLQRGAGPYAVRIPDVDASGCVRLVLAPRGTQAVADLVTARVAGGRIYAHEELVRYPSASTATVAYQRFLTSAARCAASTTGTPPEPAGYVLTGSPLGKRVPAFLLRRAGIDTGEAHALLLRGRYLVYVSGTRPSVDGATGLSDAQLETLTGAALKGLGANG